MNAYRRICLLQCVYTRKISAFILQRNYVHSQVRVRFAPSPTGYLHLGGFRTAFYNYVFSKKHNGKFILRIEDTDLSRTVKGAAEELENNLNWLFIDPDESPRKGGSYGPYFQSERREIYDKYSKLLVQNDSAYMCFCSSDRLLSLKEKRLPYDNKCRNLSPEEISRLQKENTPFCIRFKMEKVVVQFNDLIYGKRDLKTSESGDFVILKGDGMPTYHFANVVDDHLMKVTHVFRGSEWLSSMPKHLQLYNCFGWDPPLFGHLPNMTNSDGTKLSKRQKDLHVKQLLKDGYYPEAILNLIKLSGGGYGRADYHKLDTIEELVEQFQLEGVNTHPGSFDLSSLDDFNRLFIKKQANCSEGLNSLACQLKTIITQHFGDRLCMNYKDNLYKQVIKWGVERIFKLSDFTSPNFHFIWVHPTTAKSDLDSFSFDAKLVLVDLANSIQNIEPQNFMKEPINEAIKEVQVKHNLKTNKLMKLIRLVVCGLKEGPSIVESFQLTGKDNVIHRLQAASVL